MPDFNDTIEEVRSRNDIVDVVSQYVKLTKRGSTYFGLCPFHNEKTPSFSVTPAKQMYYCFGCGAGGNVFNFIMQYENFTFYEALNMLAERVHVEIPKTDMSAASREKAKEREALLEINKQAAQLYYYQLKKESGKTARDYLARRGLTEETVRNFGLGYSDKYSDTLYKFLKEKGYSDQLLRESGLFISNEKSGMTDKFWNRVIFPIMDVNRRVVGFGGRVMGDGKPKYLNSPETKIFDKSRNLYGLHAARTSRKKNIILCEGYMDVIAMHQAGFTNAVASLGTAFTTGHASLLRRYTEEVLLLYDSDDAGVRAAQRAIPILRDAGIGSRVVHLDPYKDPDEFIQNLGAEEFQKRLDAAEDSFLFRVHAAEKGFQMDSPQDQNRFFGRCAELLLEFPDELERSLYIEALAKEYRRFGITTDVLKKRVASEAMRGYRGDNYSSSRYETSKSGSGYGRQSTLGAGRSYPNNGTGREGLQWYNSTGINSSGGGTQEYKPNGIGSGGGTQGYKPTGIGSGGGGMQEYSPTGSGSGGGGSPGNVPSGNTFPDNGAGDGDALWYGPSGYDEYGSYGSDSYPGYEGWDENGNPVFSGNAEMPGSSGTGSNTGMSGGSGTGRSTGMPGGSGAGRNTGMSGNYSAFANAGYDGPPGNKSASRNGRPPTSASDTAQRLILTWLANDPAIYRQVRRYIKPQDFTEPFYQEVAEMTFAQLEEGNLNPGALLNAFTDSEDQQKAAAIFHTEIPLKTEQDQDTAFAEAILRIRTDSLEKKNREWDPGDMKGLEQLIKEKKDLETLNKNKHTITVKKKE